MTGSTFLTHALPPPDRRPVVLCIGGSDSAGLAGIQMDGRCLQSLGVHAATVITAATAQNNQGLYALNAETEEALASQLDAALALEPAAIKIGLLANAGQVRLLVEKLAGLQVPIILDTVLATSSGGTVLDEAARHALVSALLPLATVVTPNLVEAGELAGMKTLTEAECLAAARALRDHGPQWVIVKGGHADAALAEDLCLGPDEPFWLGQPWVDTPHLRGTGCAFASLLAGAIALGFEIRDALVITRMAMQAGLENAQPAGGERGCLVPTGFPRSHWPHYRSAGQPVIEQPFPSVRAKPEQGELGLYPIVDSADWLARLLPLGITTAQLRVKELEGEVLAAQVARAIAIGRDHDCRLFINDHWQLAIELGAYGVHLGQEDIETADLEAIQAAGLRLGISNHSHFELVRARALKPSYLAVGPVFATTTKDMPWIPHGLDGLAYWQSALGDYPLVAIAGINEANIGEIAATGVSGVAMITAITLARDPEQTALDLAARVSEAVS